MNPTDERIKEMCQSQKREIRQLMRHAAATINLTTKEST